MKLSIGIVGLPNVGKSLLFKILTKQEVNIANYPFCTINPNVGVVPAKDERLEKIAAIMGSKQILPAVFEFVDIAGLVRGAHQGAGLGNQFLAQIREADAIIHLVRIFQDSEIVHFEGKVEPLADFEAVEDELRMKDEQSQEKENLLSKKPQLIVLNGEPSETPGDLLSAIKEKGFPYLTLNLKNGLIKEDLQNIFKAFFVLLDLITFYTANENEARSWFVKKGTLAPQAAGVVHTDFENKFIKAEVINWQKLIETGSWNAAKQKGLIRLEGKEYVVQDGDIMVIKHG
jgi:hypothetical protein